MPHPTGRYFFRMVTSLDCGNITERNLAAIPGILFLFRELNIVKSFSPKLLSQNLYPATIVEHKIYHSFLFSGHACMLSGFICAWLCATLWMAAHQAPLSKGFSRQEHWSGLPFPLPDFRALFYPPESLFCGCILFVLHMVWLKSLSINLRIILWILPRLSKYFCKCKNQESMQLSLSHVKFCVHVCTPTHTPFSVPLGGKTHCSLYLVIYGHLYPLSLLT